MDDLRRVRDRQRLRDLPRDADDARERQSLRRQRRSVTPSMSSIAM